VKQKEERVENEGAARIWGHGITFSDTPPRRKRRLPSWYGRAGELLRRKKTKLSSPKKKNTPNHHPHPQEKMSPASERESGSEVIKRRWPLLSCMGDPRLYPLGIPSTIDWGKGGKVMNVPISAEKKGNRQGNQCRKRTRPTPKKKNR